jgi:hypothetical protein
MKKQRKIHPAAAVVGLGALVLTVGAGYAGPSPQPMPAAPERVALLDEEAVEPFPGSIVLQGTLRVEDPGARTFTVDVPTALPLAGEDVVLIAPPGIDLAALEGADVAVEVDEYGRVTSIRPTAGERT